MDFIRRHTLARTQQKRKAQSAPLYGQKHKYCSPKINKRNDQCQTPSTDDNHSQTSRISKTRSLLFEKNLMNYNKLVDSWRNDLLDLFQLIYIEDYQFADLSEYFTYSVCLVRNLSSFHQILYDSIKIYFQRIKSTIYHSINEISDYRMIQKEGEEKSDFSNILFKSFGQHSTKYCQVLSLLMKSYQMVEEKSLEISKIVNFFMMYISSFNNNNNSIHNNNKEQTIHQINCAELHRTLFIEIILKDGAIKTFLDNLTFIQSSSKFYQLNFKQSFLKLSKINILRSQKSEPLILSEKVAVKTESKSTNAFNDLLRLKNRKLEHMVNDVSDLFVSPKEIKTKPTNIFYITNINLKVEPEIVIYTNSNINPIETKEECMKIVSPKISTNTNTTSNTVTKINSEIKKQKKNKNKNKNKQVEYKDDIKELERKMEIEHELSKKVEKIHIDFPSEWVNKLKHKSMQVIKHLH